MEPTLTPYLEIADKLGVMVLGVAFIIALYRKVLVFGWLYAECEKNLDLHRTELAARASKMEEELALLRQERRSVK
jgi:hypothetical protein